VTIPWDSRQALLDRLRQAGGAGQIIRAFDAAGTSAPVKLDRSAKRRLLTVCEDWLDEMNIDGLPEGIFDLRNALFDERAYGQLDE
jgi:hypothetical protein